MAAIPTTQIAQAAYDAGFRGLSLIYAVAIALAESRGDPTAHCLNCTGVVEDSRGLWQINVNAHPQLANVNLYDPAINAIAAYGISSGSDFTPWSTFTNGAYKSFLTTAGEAITAIGQIAVITVPPGTPSGPPVVPGQPPGPTVITTPTTTPTGTPGGSSTIDIPTPFGTIHVDLSGIQNALSGIGTSASTAAQGLVAGVNNASATVNNATDFLKWLGQPNLVLRFALFPIGVGVALLGLVLFALSFWPRGTQVVQSGVAALAE